EQPELQRRRPRCWDFRPTLCGDPPGGKLAPFCLPFADLPDEKLPEATFCFPKAFGKVLGERESELQRRARVRFLQASEGLLGELEQLDVAHRQRREQMLAAD